MLGQGVLRIVLAAWRLPTCPWRAVQGCIAQVNPVLVHACNPTARPACSSGGYCSDSLADEAWSGAICSTISAPSLKRRLCRPCPTEADDSSAGGVARLMMRSCVHAEMKIDTRGPAECRCASTALLVGKRGTGAQPPRAIERWWRQLPASAGMISRWMWRLEKVSLLLYRRV